MTELFRRLPPMSSLVAFEAAYRHQSFTRAANELALSQASISRRVRELEEFLGCKLFERKRYDVVATADGDSFALSVCASLNEIAKTTDRLRVPADGKEQITLFTDISLAHALVAPMIGQIQKTYPNYRIRVIASSEAIDTVHESFDFGLQYGQWGADKFIISPIGDEVLFPVCSPEFATRLLNPVTPLELAKQPLVQFSEAGRTWPDWRSFLGYFDVETTNTVEELTFSSYQICLDVAEQGSGVALGWGRTVQSRLDAGTLIRIPALAIKMPDAINLYQSKHVVLDPIITEVADLLRESLRDNDVAK